MVVEPKNRGFVFPPNPWNFPMGCGIHDFHPPFGGVNTTILGSTPIYFPVIYGYIRGSKIEAILRIPG